MTHISILLIEDIGEQPYRVDRLLNQLKLAKVFKQINGVILVYKIFRSPQYDSP